MSNISIEHGKRHALTLFTADEFVRFWPDLEQTLDCVPHTWRYWTKEAIYDAIMNGRIQVWGVGEPPKATLILFTSIGIFPAMKVFSVMWAAGRFEDEMLPLLDATLTNYAALNECNEIEIRGRVGWEPKLKSIGFRREASMWSRPVKRHTLN